MPKEKKKAQKGRDSKGRFVKGTTVSGRPKYPQELKEIRKLTQESLLEVGELLLFKTKEEIKELAKDPYLPMLHSMVLSCCLRVLRNGDPATLNTLLARFIGKVPDSLYIKAEGDTGNDLPVASPTQMIESSKRICQYQIMQLEAKAKAGNPLTLDEQRRLESLGATIARLSEEERRIRGGENPISGLSDEELKERVGKLITIKGSSTKSF